jgi:hypothetical protein
MRIAGCRESVTLKAINICLAKLHFQSRSTAVMSRPFGLIIDPSIRAISPPRCVHSLHAKERKIFQWGTGLMRKAG